MTSFDYWLQNQNRPERYQFTITNPDGSTMRFNVDGKDKMLAKKESLKASGDKFKCEKLYPFSTEKNQHNFELIRNICFNRMADMESGYEPMDKKEYERLETLRDKASEFWWLPLPVAWLTWEKYQEAKQLCMEAREHRANACVEAGRPDLVRYC